ncbi:hypothetical protein CASFOL_031581 [Castilleja foliolosa]|uniref:F-box domain-containing protein n=1 Tax=Castilleja foliolosa TaxID=1961234 RepID=A0ABD3C544_9LAMI
MADYMQKTEWLLEEILVRVPGKDLANSKLVCKDWCDLIKSPNFVSAYNHHILSQGLLKKDNKRKSNWDDEDLDDNDMKDSSEEEEDEPTPAPKTEPMPTKKAHKKTASETVEKKRKRFEALKEAPLDPVEEKLCQQRLVGEADYKSTAELFGKMGKTLDNFIPKSEGDFTEYAELVADKLCPYEKNYHYIGLLKAVMRLSMVSLTGSDATDVASSITAIVNEKIKVEMEANAGKKKTEDESVPNLLKMDYKLKSNLDDEDLDDNDVKDSWEEEDEPALAPKTESMPTEKACAEGNPSALVSSSQKIRKFDRLSEDEETKRLRS